ncbi:DUF1750-domain-containing protein [Mollisia scopiformis]|uniref:DUF1750-domain-containing protein n=1 Tax=Mollisia scopiformis TaxID=149040 RepID=A0A194XEC4_MOLSC|nr:DUF1750-domain-containing protein [Mollisia scopiformis]KUJ18496.1 DUF1750-domain-containing protein [Mollisia scopiformis]
MQDPSQGIQRDLLPHVHLLSTYRFPLLPQLHPDKVAEWLLGAPKITHANPFYWTYLDRPADGTILLLWQSPTLGNEYASDGYVWPPQETAFQVEVSGGYILEMHQHKSGYGPNEPVAAHARRRYRLLPPRNSNNAGASPDPSLWIVHYTQAEPQERIPSNVIPIDMRTQNMMQTRSYLHSQGQIIQKEFVLHDRASWPQIAFPRGPPRGPPMYGGNVPPARVPQTMAYPPAHAAGPPAKRARTQANANQAAANSAAAVLDADEEEDTSRGDLFDHVSPRDISMNRYKQNHEWMEEVLSSPYSLNQIIPADLGLGLRGELSSLTDGIFDAPQDPETDVEKHLYVGRLDPEKAEEFRKRANEQIAQTNKDIEKAKAKHAKRLAKFQKGSLITISEKALRTAVNDPTDTGPEYWRLEGRIDEDDGEEGKTVSRIPSKVDDIVAQVEASVGRHAAAVKELIRIQDGGYEEAPAAPSPQAAAESTPRVTPPGSNNGSQHSGVLVGDVDMDMSNSAAGLLDQYHTGLSSNATPGSNFATPQPHLQAHSSTSTPNLNVPSPQPNVQQPENDVPMGDAAPSEQTASGDASGTGDWVVVPPGGVSPGPTSAQDEAPATSTPLPSENVPAPATSAISHPSPLPTTTAPTSSANTPGLPDFHTSPNDFADLGDLDTAGDALASYGDDISGEHEDLGDMGLDMDVGMDDSAFGDAFHGVEQRGPEDGEGLGEGL